AVFAKSQRYQNKSEDARALARAKSESPREGQPNPNSCWQPCAPPNLLYTPPSATVFARQSLDAVAAVSANPVAASLCEASRVAHAATATKRTCRGFARADRLLFRCS